MKFAMRFEEPDIQKKWLPGRLLQEAHCRWRNFCNMHSRGLDNIVVSNYRGILGDVLHANESGSISIGPQCMQDMLLVVIERKPSMRKSEHSVVVRTMPSQKTGAAGRASGRGAECMPEQYPLAG